MIISAVERNESVGSRESVRKFLEWEYATIPVNMGNVINTEMEESSPFMSSDNVTLYFASKGHNGFGGHDIFTSTRLDETWTNWSTPKNLGPAVNSSMDDEFFTLTQNGHYAIFSRQVNVHNIDLYKIPMSELFIDHRPLLVNELVKLTLMDL